MKNYTARNNTFLFSLLLLFPASLISGPLIPELIMNAISIFVIIRLVQDKTIEILHNNFFYYYLVFVIYITLNAYFSSYEDEIFLKNVFYFRFLTFIFAVYYIFLINRKIINLLYFAMIFVFSILVIDGFIEFFFGKNLLGNTSYRGDRIASLFGVKLVLGTFLAKYFFFILGLFLFIKQEKIIIKYYSLIILFLAFILIFLTGERTAFIATSFGIIIFFICSNFSIYRKILVLLFLILSIVLILFNNSTMYDRHIKQTFNQVNFNVFADANSFFKSFVYYELTYKTAYNAFITKKLFGHGPKSFRYFCSQEGIEVKSVTKREVNNDKLFFDVGKKLRGLKIIKLYVSENDEISINDLILSYEHNNNSYDFRSNREGIIKVILTKQGDYIENNHLLLELDLSKTDVPLITSYDINGCTTHPHNFYLQLLSETGIVGMLFILLNFLYLIFILTKFLYKKLFLNTIELSNTKICLIINFIIFLIPVLPNGNFFNNWLNMTILIQISFYLFIFNKDKLIYKK